MFEGSMVDSRGNPRPPSVLASDQTVAVAVLQTFPEERSEDDLDIVLNYLKELPAQSRRYFNLEASRSKLRYLCKHIKLLTPAMGTLIYRQGEVGDKFYVIVQGVCEVMHAPVRKALSPSASGGSKNMRGETGGAGVAIITKEQRQALGCRVGVLPAGECFGEHTIGRERDASVLCNGHRANGALMAAQILQIDGKAYRRCVKVMFDTVSAVLKRRSARLQKLFLFEDWPCAEVEFFAYWMKEFTYKPGTTIYKQGDPVKLVYFVVSGRVDLSTKPEKRPESDFVVQIISPPSCFGHVEIVEREETRTRTATVGGDEPAVMAAMPVSVFWRLMLSEGPAAAYKSALKMETMATNEQAWHQLRLDDIEDTGDVHPSLLHEIQCRFLGCAFCGEKNHVPDECPYNEDADTLPHTGPKGAEPQAESKEPPPVSGAALVARRQVGAPTTPSRPGSRGSVGSRRSPGGGSPRSRRGTPNGTPRSGTPRSGTPSRELAVDGDDWNEKPKEEVVSKLDDTTKLNLLEAKKDMRAVMKAVIAFKRLVTRRRAERAAAAGEGPPVQSDQKLPRVSSASSHSRPHPVDTSRSSVAAVHGDRLVESKSAPTSFTVNDLPEELLLSGSLARPVLRKSKSISDLPPIRHSNSRRRLKSSSSATPVEFKNFHASHTFSRPNRGLHVSPTAASLIGKSFRR